MTNASHSRPAHRRPALPGQELFETQGGGADPAMRTEVGARIASILIRGARDTADHEIADRVMRLADEEGLDTLAEWWAEAPVDSLAGALWRLYVLRTWVRREPERAAREYGAGRSFSPVHEVVAGVVDPPGPREAADLVDTVLRGLVVSDLAVALDRAAAFARLVAVGRAHLAEDPPESTQSAARLIETALALERAARHERAGKLT